METSQALRILISDVAASIDTYGHIMLDSQVQELKEALSKTKRLATKLEKENK